MTCNPNELANLVKDLCIPNGKLKTVWIGVLCEWANAAASPIFSFSPFAPGTPTGGLILWTDSNGSFGPSYYSVFLATADIPSVTAVRLVNTGIKVDTVAGLQQFDNLASFQCWNNAITDIDVSGMSILASLRCYNNSLVTLDVSGCPLLIEVLASGNSLDAAHVDAVLCDLDANGAINGTVDVSLNTAPTAAGAACAGNLTVKGWTVTTD